MLSRVADSLYWMSRYLERAEHTVRLLDVNMSLMLDRSGTTNEMRWNRVLNALGLPTATTWPCDHDKLVRDLTFEAANKASIRTLIVIARENARQVRDEISSEQWQQLNRLYHQVTEADSHSGEIHLEEYLPEIMDGLLLFQGVTDSTMSHGEGWYFIQMGRCLERAFATVRLIDLYSQHLFMHEEDESDGFRFLEWIGILRCCTAFEAYCRVYTADLNHGRILEFLLLSDEFPHSVRHSIDRLSLALNSLQKGTGRKDAEGLVWLAAKLQAKLHFVEVQEILSDNPSNYLYDVMRQCQQIHEQLYQHYFQYSIQSALAS